VVSLKKHRHLNLLGRIRHEFDSKFLHTSAFTATSTDQKALNSLLPEYDIVWVHTIQTANSFGIFKWPKSILDIDDIHSRYYIAASEPSTRLFRKLLDKRMAVIWRRREKLYYKRFDAMTVCSHDDRKYLGDSHNTFVVPNGFTLPDGDTYRRPATPPRIGFIGTFRYHPNRDGIEWFVREAWPFIKQKYPDAKLRLVGDGSDKNIANIGPDIDGLGFIEDPGHEISTWNHMIVPVRIGAGTRIKIAEGFARGCPIVATPLGAMGYAVVNGQELFIADDASQFADACMQLIENDQLAMDLIANGRKFFNSSLTWDSFKPVVQMAIKTCLSSN
jgi:glycosyltransferase involved in cell wall biosynthesis